MTRLRAVLFLVLAALVLAGCTGSNSTNSPGPSGPVIQDKSTQDAAARALLASAAAGMPEKYGMDLALSSGTKELLSIHGAFDNASGTSYAELKGDVSAFSRGGGSQAQMAAPYLANGLTVYVTKQGSLYLANGTAFVFPAGAQSGSSLIPTPDKSPIGALLTPANGPLKDVLSSKNITITSANATQWKGKDALRIEGLVPRGNQTLPAVVVIYSSPARLAHVETTMPTDPASPTDPLAGAKAVADFAYESDVTIQPSAAATRALGLAYKSDKSGFASFSSSGPTTWTFTGSGGIALSEVEAQVRNGSSASGDITTAPILWTMKLSEGTHTANGVTLTFTDADHDGKVSPGDKLKTESAGDSTPLVILKDTTTGTLVVPGAPLVLVLGLVAVAGALLRRRS